MMMMRSALYQTSTLSWIVIVLDHSNNSLRIDKQPHSDTLSCFRANQSLLFLLNAACLAEKQNTNFIVCGLTRSVLGPTIYCTRGEHVNYYTTRGEHVNYYTTRGEHVNYYTTRGEHVNYYTTRGEHVNYYTTRGEHVNYYTTRGEHVNYYTTDVVIQQHVNIQKVNKERDTINNLPEIVFKK